MQYKRRPPAPARRPAFSRRQRHPAGSPGPRPPFRAWRGFLCCEAFSPLQVSDFLSLDLHRSSVRHFAGRASPPAYQVPSCPLAPARRPSSPISTSTSASAAAVAASPHSSLHLRPHHHHHHSLRPSSTQPVHTAPPPPPRSTTSSAAGAFYAALHSLAPLRNPPPSLTTPRPRRMRARTTTTYDDRTGPSAHDSG